MQAPPKHRERPAKPAQRPRREDGPPVVVPDLEPRTVIAPLIPLVLVAVLAAFAVVVALVLLPIFGAAGVGVNAFRERLDAAGVGGVRIPDFPETSTIYAADGSVLAEIFLDENRRYVKIHKIAQVAQDAVIAIEDDSFYEHGALNFPSLIRAAIANLVAGQIEQGGSTLTQQLVKNVLIDSPEQTFARKFQEAALAIRVERKYTKDKILELYMNEAYYGNGAYGIETAAETYFHTTANKLTLRQAALLAGIVRAPGAYDPVTHPQAARARRDEVIDKMLELGWVDPAAAAIAKAKPLGIANDVGVFKQKVEPFFVYYIRNLILDNENGEFDALGTRRIQRVHTLYQGGLKIYTSLDPAWQDYGQDAINASPYIHADRNSPDASLVGSCDRWRDQGDDLGQELHAGPVRPRLARDEADGFGLQAVHAGGRVRARHPAGQGVFVQVAAVQPRGLDQRKRVREQRRGRGRRRVPRPVGRDAGLGERGLRAARARRRTREHRGRRPPHGHHGRARPGPVDHPGGRGGPDDGHGLGLRDARQRREALRTVGGAQDRVRIARAGRRRHPGQGRGEAGARAVPAPRRLQAGDRSGDRAPGHRDAAAGRVLRHRDGRPDPGPARRWQDRHGPGLHQRLLRRLYAAGRDRRMGRVPRRAAADGLVLRELGVRWHRGRPDLAGLHGAGDAGLPCPGVRGAAGAGKRRGAGCGGPADRAGRARPGEGQLHADQEGGPVVRARGHGPHAVARSGRAGAFGERGNAGREQRQGRADHGAVGDRHATSSGDARARAPRADRRDRSRSCTGPLPRGPRDRAGPDRQRSEGGRRRHGCHDHDRDL